MAEKKKAEKKKRRAHGEGSIRERNDGTWEARFVTGIDPGTGKPIRKSVYGKTQTEVRQKLTAAIAALDNGTYQAPDKTTLATWLNEWLTTFCKSKVKPLTYQAYAGLIKNHIVPAIGNLKLQEVTGIHVQRLYNQMADNNFSPKTIRNVGIVLHKAFDVLKKQPNAPISINPCDSAEPPKVKRSEISPLSDEDIPRFLAAINDSPLRNAYALCLFAGLREGECLGLSWKQVDFRQGKITVSQQLQQNKTNGFTYYISDTTKNGKSRIIKPPTIAFEYLRAEQEKQAQNMQQADTLWSNPDGLVFTNELGKHRSFASFYKNFKKIAASIGRPDARPHDLRHTAATVAIASGADIKSVQELMGHATSSFTLDVYAHASERMLTDTADRMQGYYDGLGVRKPQKS